MNKYIINSTLIFLLLIFNLIFITSCGVNSPTNAGQSTTLSNNQNVSINAYKGEVHKQVLSMDAVNLLLLPSNPGKLTPKQINILNNFGTYIEEGAYNEDYDNPYGLPNVLPVFRTNNHFMDPQHNNSALTDPPLNPLVGTPQNALNWMYSGDQYMFKTAKAEFDDYMRTHANVPIIPGDPKLKDIMRKLGHILHMYQDMTSPPHVRNDNHSGLLSNYITGTPAGRSQFEELGFAAFTPDINNIDIKDTKIISQFEINTDEELKARFIELAKSTSEHYFSEDTIPDPNYLPPSNRLFSLPQIPDPTAYPTDISTNLIYIPSKNNPLIIAKLEIDILPNGTVQKSYTYTLKDDVDTVPKYYSSQLMPKAIAYSAAVIKYFLSEPPVPPQNNPTGGGNTGGSNTARGKIYVANNMTNTVSVIDGATNKVIKTIPVGLYPYSIVVNASTGKAYVTNYTSGTVSVIDIINDIVIKTINTARVRGIAINPYTNRIYVTSIFDTDIRVIDGNTDTVVNTFTIPKTNAPLGNMQAIGYIAVNPHTQKIYTTHFIGNNPDITILDESTGAVTGTISKPPLSALGGIAVDYTVNKAYFLYDSFVGSGNGNILIVDGNTNAEVGSIILPSGTYSSGLCVNQQANLLYITSYYSGAVITIDLSNNSIINTVSAGIHPYGVGFSPSANNIYVANWDAFIGGVTVIDAASYAQIATISFPYFSYPVSVGIFGLQSTSTNINTNKNILQDASSSIPDIGIAGF